MTRVRLVETASLHTIATRASLERYRGIFSHVVGPDRVDQIRRRYLADEQRAVAKLPHRFVLIVTTAPKLNVLDGRLSAAREWDDVVKLQECGLAAAALASFERTAAAVTRPDGTAH